MATLQHALTRGIDLVFQIEESEVLSEPTPTRDSRRAILSLEASDLNAGRCDLLLDQLLFLQEFPWSSSETQRHEKLNLLLWVRISP